MCVCFQNIFKIKKNKTKLHSLFLCKFMNKIPGAPGEILPRAANWPGPALHTRRVFFTEVDKRFCVRAHTSVIPRMIDRERRGGNCARADNFFLFAVVLVVGYVCWGSYNSLYFSTSTINLTSSIFTYQLPASFSLVVSFVCVFAFVTRGILI